MRTGAQSQHVKPASRMTRRPCWRMRASNSKLDGLVSLFNHLVRSDDGFSDWEPSSSAWIHRSLLGIECHGTWIPRSAKTASEVNFEPQATTGTPVPGLETQKKRGNKCEWWKKKKGGGRLKKGNTNWVEAPTKYIPFKLPCRMPGRKLTTWKMLWDKPRMLPLNKFKSCCQVWGVLRSSNSIRSENLSPGLRSSTWRMFCSKVFKTNSRAREMIWSQSKSWFDSSRWPSGTKMIIASLSAGAALGSIRLGTLT